MKVLVIGSGRMGLRHAEGASMVDHVSEVYIVDKENSKIEEAKSGLKHLKLFKKIKFISNFKIEKLVDFNFEIVILATTAAKRFELVRKVALVLNPKYLLIEKPLEQNYTASKKICNLFEIDFPNINAFVNLSMRQSPNVIKLKQNILEAPQLKGLKSISLNTGSLGIGANGIHYIDMLFFLLGAEYGKIEAAAIDDKMIQSGRGAAFGDFGGWSYIKLFDDKNILLCNAFLSFSSESTAVGQIEILAENGKISFDEIRLSRTDSLRNIGSTLPVYRYHGDYLQDNRIDLIDYTLADLTASWIINLKNNINTLPSISESMKAHKLMFEWLNFSTKIKDKFPIT